MPMLNCRLSDADWEDLMARVARSGLDRSSYIRWKLLDRNEPPAGSPSVVPERRRRVELEPVELEPVPVPRVAAVKAVKRCDHPKAKVRILNGGVRFCDACSRVVPNARIV